MSGLIQRILSLSRHARPGLRPSLFSSFFFYKTENVLFFVGVFIFGSVRFLSKKITKPNFFLKNRNRFKPTGFGSVRFCRAKTGSNRFCSVFFGSGSVFLVPDLKNRNRTGWFFQNFNWFFFTVRFFRLFFFPVFSV